MLSLLLSVIALGAVQDPAASEFLVIVVDQETRAPVANCEIIVGSDLAEENSEEDVVADALLHGLQIEKLLHASPLRYRTDESGRIRIPTPPEFFMIGAIAADGREAYRGLVDPRYEGDITLALHAPMIARVRCVDAAGEPVAGVPFALSPRGIYWPLRRVQTDSNGIAAFPCIDLYRTAAEQGFFSDLEVILGIPVNEPWRLPIDDLLWAKTPPSVTMPLIGSVEVALPSDWRPTGTQAAVLRLGATGQDAGTVLQIPLGAASVRFPQVGLGLQYRLQIADTGSGTAVPLEFTGPTEPGETVSVTYSPPVPDTGWVLRPLDPEGEPMPNTSFEVHWERWNRGGGGQRSLRLRSDAAGLITLEPVTPEPEQGLFYFHLRRRSTEESRQCRALINMAEVGSSSQSQPMEIRFEHPHVVAAGRVVDRNGDPIPRALVRAGIPYGGIGIPPVDEINALLKSGDLAPSEIQSFLSERTLTRTEPGMYCTEVRTDEDGRFELIGVDRRSGFSVFVERGGYDDGKASKLANGVTDLEFMLLPRGEVSGRLLLDEDISPYSFSIAYLSEEYGNSWEQANENGEFRFGARRNGKARVTVRAQNGWVLFHEAHVEIQSGELLDDSDVREIDLRGKVFPITISVEAAAGAEIDRFTIRPADAVINPRCEAWGDSWVLLLDKLPADLKISRPRYRTVELKQVSEDQDVVLQPGPELPVSIAQPEWIPEGYGIKLWFQNPRELARWNEWIPASGVGTLTLSDPGEYTVRVTMASKDGIHWHTLYEKTIQVADLNNPTFRIHLDPEELHRLAAKD